MSKSVIKPNFVSIFMISFLMGFLVLNFTWSSEIIKTNAQSLIYTSSAVTVPSNTTVILVNSSSSSNSVVSSSSSMSSVTSMMSSSSVIPETKVISTNDFAGNISRKEGNKIYVTKDNLTKEYTLTGDVTIKKDTFNSSLDKLEVGDSVTVKESTGTGTVVSIEAVSRGVEDYSKMIIPAVLGLLALSALAYYLYKKSNTGHIQTNKVNRS
jgi:hypothetical protein